MWEMIPQIISTNYTGVSQIVYHVFQTKLTYSQYIGICFLIIYFYNTFFILLLQLSPIIGWLE